MAQPFYRPRFKKQLTGSTLGPYNCNMASAAMLADRDTLGQLNVTSDAMRKASGDTSGGTSQQAAVTALAKYGITVDSYDAWDNFDIADMDAALRAGKAIGVAGDYDQLPLSLKGDKDFFGDHRVVINEILSNGNYLVFDPIADGRRTGIPKSPLQWPRDVMRRYVLDMVGPDVWAIVLRRRRAKAKVATANIRAGAGTAYPIIGTLSGTGTLARGSKPTIGDPVGANRVWYRVWDPRVARVGYMHSSVITLL